MRLFHSRRQQQHQSLDNTPTRRRPTSQSQTTRPNNNNNTTNGRTVRNLIRNNSRNRAPVVVDAAVHDPWSQAAWPQQSDPSSEEWFGGGTKSTNANNNDWFAPFDGSQLQPIPVHDDEKARERDILAKRSSPRNSSVADSSRRSSSGRRIEPKRRTVEAQQPTRRRQPEWTKPVQDRLFSSDTIPDDDDDDMVVDHDGFAFHLRGPRSNNSNVHSPTDQTEVSGLTNPTFASSTRNNNSIHQNSTTKQHQQQLHMPNFADDPFAAFGTEDPFFPSPPVNISTDTHGNKLHMTDPALDHVDMSSASSEEGDNDHHHLDDHVDDGFGGPAFFPTKHHRNQRQPQIQHQIQIQQQQQPAQTQQSMGTMELDQILIPAPSPREVVPDLRPTASFQDRLKARRNVASASETKTTTTPPVEAPRRIVESVPHKKESLTLSRRDTASVSSSTSRARASVALRRRQRRDPTSPRRAETNETGAAFMRRPEPAAASTTAVRRPEITAASTTAVRRPEIAKPATHGKISAVRRGVYTTNNNNNNKTTKALENQSRLANARTDEVDGKWDESKSVGDESSSTYPDLNHNKTSDSLQSVGSDIRRLRSILKRSRTDGTQGQETLQSAFAVQQYDDRDPMQRAGLRLLSAAVVPIQCLVRRHLALREALTRMWAIVIIQACARRWFVQSRQRRERQAATQIQSLYRAGVVRDRLLLEQCCAIEIQRHVRGLLATLDVYEKIYRITVIQSATRRFLAMNEAMDRMVSIIQIQSVARTFLVRKKLAIDTAAATQIQKTYRGFSARFNYQLDLLDIIVVQSVWRRRKAQQTAAIMRYHRNNHAATVIQTQWRSYDCTMNYLHFLADVLIAQSAVRRWKARLLAKQLKHHRILTVQCFVRMSLAKLELRRRKAVVTIQRTWRGFVCYADYMFTIADIVIVQSLVRRRLAAKRYAFLYEQRRQDSAVAIQGMVRRAQYKNRKAALTIQRYWRGFVCQTELMILKYEHRAAVLIQSTWRRFWHFSNFVISLDSAMMIQATVRGYQAARRYQDTQIKVLIIQRAIRGFLRRRVQFVEDTADDILAMGRVLSRQSEMSAVLIQRSYLRANQTHEERCFEAARAIQTYWRRYTIRHMFVDFLSARAIQTKFRGYVQRKAFVDYQQARKIQAAWRAYRARTDVQTYLAARRIQSHWRGLRERLVYGEYKSAQRIQAAWRCYAVRQLFLDFLAARTIQSWWRGCTSRGMVHEHVAARKIQSVYRGYRDRSDTTCDMILRTAAPLGVVQEDCATRIQAAWRAVTVRRSYRTFVSARRIQTWWRGLIMRRAYVRYRSATRIQAFWRGNNIHRRYLVFTSARTIQKYERRRAAYAAYRVYVAARVIQKHARGFWIRNCYQEYTAARTIQRYERGRRMRVAYRKYCAARTVQRHYRGHSIRNAYREYTAARTIQSLLRGYLIRYCYKEYRAARIIQKYARSYLVKTSYHQYASARKIQKTWRAYIVRSSYRFYLAARCIQTAWRRKSAQLFVTVVRETQREGEIRGTCKLQALCRGYLYRRDHRTFRMWKVKLSPWYRAAVKIQSLVRGNSARLLYWEALGSAIQMQRMIRGWVARVRFSRSIMYFRAAQLIQARYRGGLVRHSFRSLGAAIQIQSEVRRYQAQMRFLEMIGSAIVLQTIFRGYAARKVANEMRIVGLICDRASDRMPIELEREFIEMSERERREVAARKIQKFFLWVKAEVDREIRLRQQKMRERKQRSRRTSSASRRREGEEDRIPNPTTSGSNKRSSSTSKRRESTESTRSSSNHKQRNSLGNSYAISNQHGGGKSRRGGGKSKKKMDDDDDELLENIFESIAPSGRSEKIRNAEQAAAREIRRRKQLNGVDLNDPHMVAIPEEYRGVANLDRSEFPRTLLLDGKTTQNLPHGGDADQMSDVSSASIYYRVPPPRFQTFSQKQMDDDFDLEEAWIDTEIWNARERRQASKKTRRKRH